MISVCLVNSAGALVLSFFTYNEKSTHLLAISVFTVMIYYLKKSYSRRRLLISFDLENNKSVHMLEIYIDYLFELYHTQHQKQETKSILHAQYALYADESEKFKFKMISKKTLFVPLQNLSYHVEDDFNFAMFANLIYDIYDYSLKKLPNNFNLMYSFSNFLCFVYVYKYKIISTVQKAIASSMHLNEIVFANNLIQEYNQSVSEGEYGRTLNNNNLCVVFFTDNLSKKIVKRILNLCSIQVKLWSTMLSLADKVFYKNCLSENLNNTFFSKSKQIYKEIWSLEHYYSTFKAINPEIDGLIKHIYKSYKYYIMEDEEFNYRPSHMSFEKNL